MVKRCLMLISFLGFCQLLFATTLRVGKLEKLHAIRDALALAQNGDTVLVKAGFYQEGNIRIAKRIVFMGEGKPVLDGAKKFEVVTIAADSVWMQGFVVQRSGMATLNDPGGIKVLDASHVTITNNQLIDNFFGIYIQYGKHCTVRNNQLRAFGLAEQQIGNGIHCWKSDSLLIIHNNIVGHRDGIYFEFVTHSLIWRNTATKNIRYGLHFMFSNNDSYITNVFKDNGAGVAVMFSKQVYMHNNSFNHNWGDASYGLLLKEISDGIISGNHFVKNTSAIFMEGTNRIRVTKNSFLGNGWAMQIQASCMDNVVEKNNFIGNSFDVGTNGDLVLNVFNDNYWDKYEGYDLDKNGNGDVPYRPLSLFSVIVEKNPSAMLLFRSFFISLLDRSEKVFPTLTPETFTDKKPRIKPVE